MTPEKKVQNEILKYLKKLQELGKPVFYERRQAGGYSYKKGIPDIYAVIEGIHVEIEVKSKSGHLSPMQEKFQKMCEEFNILYICANDVSQVEQFLSSLLP